MHARAAILKLVHRDDRKYDERHGRGMMRGADLLALLLVLAAAALIKHLRSNGKH